MPDSFVDAVAAFGTEVTRRFTNPGASGAPEDQLRTPLEKLLTTLAVLSGIPERDLLFNPENSLADLATRPNYAVSLRQVLVGHIEVKAPGKGADPRRFTSEHDKRQWAKLKALPNLMYTDGNAFGLWRNGELIDRIVQLDDDIASAGRNLRAPPQLETLVADFLRWQPVAPRTPKQLAETSARLCRLLRDEVSEELQQQNLGLTALAKDWRDLLFPEADDVQFADGYAQAVTFGLLVARARHISLANGSTMPPTI